MPLELQLDDTNNDTTSDQRQLISSAFSAIQGSACNVFIHSTHPDDAIQANATCSSLLGDVVGTPIVFLYPSVDRSRFYTAALAIDDVIDVASTCLAQLLSFLTHEHKAHINIVAVGGGCDVLYRCLAAYTLKPNIMRAIMVFPRISSHATLQCVVDVIRPSAALTVYMHPLTSALERSTTLHNTDTYIATACKLDIVHVDGDDAMGCVREDVRNALAGDASPNVDKQHRRL